MRAQLLSPLQQVPSAMSNLAKGPCATAPRWTASSKQTHLQAADGHCTACQAGRQPHLRLAMSSISSSTMMLHSPMAASTTTATNTL